MRTRVVENEPTQQSQPCAKVTSWNIHSISDKRNEIGMYLHKVGIDVLALQETWRKVDQWPLRLRGFNVFESVAEEGIQGRNGVALCVRNHLVAYEIGDVSPYVVSVRILIGMTEWNIMSIYIPPKGPNTGIGNSRREALIHIRRAVRRLVDQDLGVKIAIIGDWNMKSEDIQKKIRKWRLPLVVTPCQGSPLTFNGRSVWSAIDHMVMTHEAAECAGKCHVNRMWDLSDHWPIENVIRGQLPEDGDHHENDGTIQQTTGLRVDVGKLKDSRNRIVDNNRWAAIAMDDDDDIEPMADILESTVKEICEEVEVLKAPTEGSKGPSYRLSRRAKVAIGRRREAYKLWVQQASPVKEGPRWERYQECKAVATKAKRKASQDSWLRHIVNGANALASYDMHGFWRWVKTTTQRGARGPSDMGPLQSPDTPQLLVYQPREKLMAWKLHYERLLADATGHSRDAQYWADKFLGPPVPPLEGLNGDISWGELNVALQKLKSHKAPGRDGIPPEFYKLAAEAVDEPGVGIEHPHTEMGKALLRIVNRLYKKGIPSKWNEAWVVSILKSGDPTDMNNYRGISLIVVIVKLATLVITTRLTSVLEDSGFFIKEQAGFRWREECAGHVCALYEILRRREIEEKRTYLAFIDIRKAYDTVPIEGLLRKLYMIGVSGTTLEYIRSLYSGATVRVRTKYGLSGLVQLLRGLRQGCNASPALFDIFINEILAECQELGVTVMGLDKDRNIVGLLYADDLVLICSNRHNLRDALGRIQAWGRLHEMTFGVRKCGIMGFGPQAREKVRSQEWTLDGQVIPIVDKYDYLGIPFTSELDLSVIAEARAAKGRKALDAIRPLVGCLQIPILIRVNVVKALVVPVLIYGGELWGMNAERVVKPQQVLSEALRLLARLRVRSSLTSSATLGLEFGIPPISAMVAAARTRALRKFPQLRTVIADLVNFPPKSRHQTWVTGASRWLSRYCRPASTVLVPGAAASTVKDIVWSNYNQGAKSKTCTLYLEKGFLGGRKYLELATHNPSLSRGVYWLCRLRVGAIWFASRLAAIGYIAQEYRNKCPFCNMIGAETTKHLLVVCDRWRQYRQEYLGTILELYNPTWVELLGGSNLEGGVEGAGPVNRDAGAMPVWYDDQNPEVIGIDLELPQHGDENERSVPTSALVAQYLQRMMPIRFGILQNLMEGPRADADPGMAVLIDPAEVPPDGVDRIPDDGTDEGDIDNRRGVEVASAQ